MSHSIREKRVACIFSSGFRKKIIFSNEAEGYFIQNLDSTIGLIVHVSPTGT